MLIAIASHKLLDGFALGVPVYFAGWGAIKTACAIGFTAAMTPLGVGVSMAVEAVTQGSDALLARAVILSMSAGSFFFISIVELLPAGLENGDCLPVSSIFLHLLRLPLLGGNLMLLLLLPAVL